MQSCNRYSLNAFVVFFIVYWILCTVLWILIKHQHINNIPLWLSLPLGFWSVALTLFTVLSLMLLFMRCRSGSEEYVTTFEQPEIQPEIIRSFECERQGKRFDELECVNLNRQSVEFSFVEQAPPRYVNINDIMIDEMRNDTMTQRKLDGHHMDPKQPTLMKPPLPVKKNLRKYEEPCFEGEKVMTEDPAGGVTCIPIATVRLASPLIKTEAFLYVDDATSSTVARPQMNLTDNIDE